METESHGVAASYRYQRLAAELEDKIRKGQFAAGDRLPSLRDLHCRTGLSITTVAQAYMELESRGLVAAREKSGFFVRPQIRTILPAPQTVEQQVLRPRKTLVHPLAESILSAISDKKMVPFGAALPDCRLLPSRQLVASTRTVAARYYSEGGLNYGPPDGVPELKRQIAARSIGGGNGGDLDEIVVTNGCMDAIQLCLRAVARPGDIVVTESPTFSCYLQLLEELGLLALEIPTDPETGIDLNLLEEALFGGAWRRNRVAACLINPSFHNPLGFDMPVNSRAELVEMLAAHDIPLIEDDVYGELYFGSARSVPLKCFDRKGLVLYCSSFSKTLAPDFRVGWVQPGRFREQVLRLKFNSSIAQCKLPQIILADFLENGQYDRHLRRLRVALKNQMSNVVQAIARYFPKGTRLTSPGGGYVVWVELAGGVDGVELFRRAKAEGISIIPGVISSGTGRFAHCIRMSCGTPWNEQLEDGIRRLGLLVDDLGAQ
jgi:DNA-binding transcriptional MocR family regulator